MLWQTDPIGYDVLSSYGSPAYCVQKMFSLNHGDSVLSTTTQGIPAREWQLPAMRGQVSGVAGIEPKGQLVGSAGSGPEDTNSITQPAKIVPVTTDVDGLGAGFRRSFPPSAGVVPMKAK